MFQSKETLLQLKKHSRHYYLGQASWYLRKGDYSEVDKNLGVVERMQADIDALELELNIDSTAERFMI